MRPRITAGLGHLKVSKIKPAHLMAFYDNLEEKGIRQDSSFTATAALLKLLPHGTRGALAKEAGVGQDTMRMVYAGKGVSKRTAERYLPQWDWLFPELSTSTRKRWKTEQQQRPALSRHAVQCIPERGPVGPD